MVKYNMKNVLVVILAFLMIGLQKQAMAQTPEMEVQKVIEQLFDAMRAKDGVAAGAVFFRNSTYANCGSRRKWEYSWK